MNVGKSTVSRCIVPSCKNRSDECPDKKFFTVPLKPEDRAKWYKAVFQKDFRGPLSRSRNMHCCEDHFDMEKDTANYLQHLFVHSNLRLKKGIVPHRFINEVEKVPQNVSTKYRLQKPVGILRVSGVVLPNGNHNSSVDIPVNCEEGMQMKEEILHDIKEENIISNNEGSFCETNTIANQNLSEDIPDDCEVKTIIKEEILDNITEENVFPEYESSCGTNTRVNRNSCEDIPYDCEVKTKIKQEILDDIKEENISDNESSHGSNTDSEFSTMGQINELLLDDNIDDDCIFADFVVLLLRQIHSREKRKRAKHMIRNILLENIKDIK